MAGKQGERIKTMSEAVYKESCDIANEVYRLGVDRRLRAGCDPATAGELAMRLDVRPALAAFVERVIRERKGVEA
jgi:hypothetical protein